MIGGARGARALRSRATFIPATAGLALLVGFVTVATPAAAQAAAGRVVLLQSPTASPGIRRCMTLIRDELVAGGFEVITVDPGPLLDPVSMAKRMNEQKGAVATIGLLGDPDRAPAELWILDKVGGTAEVRRISAPRESGHRAAEVLAIRTIEVLRASALKLVVEANRPKPAEPVPSGDAPAAPTTAAAAPAPPPSPRPPEPATPEAVPEATPDERRPRPASRADESSPPTVVRPPAASSESRPRSLALETGVSLLSSPGQLAPAAVPVARVRFDFTGRFSARLSLAGLGTRPRVETDRGSAAIAQELALVEVALSLRPGRRLQPILTAGAGALHVRSEAEGTFPYLGRDDARWSSLFAGGAGLVAMLGGHLAIALDTQALFAAPHPVVRFVDIEAAKVARPAFWATLTLVARL